MPATRSGKRLSTWQPASNTYRQSRFEPSQTSIFPDFTFLAYFESICSNLPTGKISSLNLD